jgi:hypothetical protein
MHPLPALHASHAFVVYESQHSLAVSFQSDFVAFAISIPPHAHAKTPLVFVHLPAKFLGHIPIMVNYRV